MRRLYMLRLTSPRIRASTGNLQMKRAGDRSSVVSCTKTKRERAIGRSLTKLKARRTELDGAVARLTHGLSVLGDEPILKNSREGVLRLIAELTEAKAELEKLVLALEEIHREHVRGV